MGQSAGADITSTYSITSSARSKIDGGTARPSALAVLRFRKVLYPSAGLGDRRQQHVAICRNDGFFVSGRWMDDALDRCSIEACPRQPQHRQWTRLREASTGAQSLSGGVGKMLADECDFD